LRGGAVVPVVEAGAGDVLDGGTRDRCQLGMRPPVLLRPTCDVHDSG
jgi:hypothetical protein